MTSLSDWELTQRLLLAAVFGAALGVEREWRNKDAGLRTNILIAIGSALFTLMSIELTDAKTGDTSRVAAQIVTGIGFLGAGAIMRTERRHPGADDRGDDLGQRGDWRRRRRRRVSPRVHRHRRSRWSCCWCCSPIEKYLDHRRTEHLLVNADKPATDA